MRLNVTEDDWDSLQQCKIGMDKILADEIGKYDPRTIDVHVEYILLQAKTGTYDAEANFNFLRLLHIHNKDERGQDDKPYFPENVGHIVAIILLKALTVMPEAHFQMCRGLIDPDTEDTYSDYIRPVYRLSEALETCQFQSFWSSLRLMERVISQISGFEDDIRRYIAFLTQNSFQRISRTELGRMLNVTNDADLKTFCQQCGWRYENDQVFIRDQTDRIKPRNVPERIDFADLRYVLNKSQPSWASDSSGKL